MHRRFGCLVVWAFFAISGAWGTTPKATMVVQPPIIHPNGVILKANATISELPKDDILIWLVHVDERGNTPQVIRYNKWMLLPKSQQLKPPFDQKIRLQPGKHTIRLGLYRYRDDPITGIEGPNRILVEKSMVVEIP